MVNLIAQVRSTARLPDPLLGASAADCAVVISPASALQRSPMGYVAPAATHARRGVVSSLLQKPGEIAALQFDPIGSTRGQSWKRNLSRCPQPSSELQSCIACIAAPRDARRVVPNDARAYSTCRHGIARPSAA